jgi:2-polyprenyl-6-methoxyphenol hydroxylase-like FAD-dependent oxidoreductase
MSFKRVVVIGGGPVGLLCAIDARNYFGTVTVVEKRTGHSRTNVPVLDDDIRKHFKALKVHTKMGLGDDAMGSAAFARIEDALEKRAKSASVKLLRPYVVTAAIGEGVAVGGRYKKANLTLAEWDDQRKTVATTGRTKQLSADLIVVASGGGAAQDQLLQSLGFTWERLKAKNYGAFAIFDDRGEGDNQTAAKVQVRDLLANYRIVLETQDHTYLLATLSGITPTDFKALQGDTKKLKDLMATIQKAEEPNLREIKEVAKNVGVFKIAIQRVRQMYSPNIPAVIVGDAAVMPHPERGSGCTTGFRGFEELHKMFEALKNTRRSKDNSIIHQGFSDRYELHVSRKAIDGTSLVLFNNLEAAPELRDRDQAEPERHADQGRSGPCERLPGVRKDAGRRGHRTEEAGRRLHEVPRARPWPNAARLRLGRHHRPALGVDRAIACRDEDLPRQRHAARRPALQGQGPAEGVNLRQLLLR